MGPHKRSRPFTIRSLAFASCAALILAVAAIGPWAGAAWPHAPQPLMKVLPLFTAPNVPEMGPAEIAVPARKPESLKPIPPGLPGKGLAQHAMLYIGEGDNKMYLINRGKIVWTYSTGSGWEYDDVWMLSNGNILFSRMQYLAEITPGKKVVWRYDAPAGTEIHTCQPIGLDKVLFIENGLPPRLKVVNIKTGVVVLLCHKRRIPQNGQWQSWRSSERARMMRRVAME